MNDFILSSQESKTVSLLSRQPALGLTIAFTFSTYLLFALGSIYLSRQPGGIASLWYANAVAMVCFQVRPSRDWGWLIAAVALANLMANLPFAELRLAMSFVLGNGVEVLAGAILIKRFCSPSLATHNAAELLKVILLGGAAACLLGASLGAALVAGSGSTSLGRAWLSWFEGSLIGMTAVLPLGMIVISGGMKAIYRDVRRSSFTTIFILTCLVTFIAPISLPYPFVYVSLSLVILALVSHPPATALATFISSLSIGSLIATGTIRPVVDRSESIEEVFFYLPLILSLLLPLLLSVTLKGAQLAIQRLAAREEIFRVHYQQSPVMMHSIDRNGRLVNASDLWLKTLGYTLKEVLGHKSIEFLTPLSQKRAVELVIPEFIAKGEAKDIEYQMITKAGDIIDVRLCATWERDSEGNPVRTLAVLQDVTEEKRLADELALEHERTAVTLKSIGDAVITTDDSANITFLNPAAERMLGWGFDEADGLPFAEVVHLYDENPNPSAEQTFGNSITLCLGDSTLPTNSDSIMLRDRRGNLYWVKQSSAPIVGKDGALLGMVMVFKDVTESRGLMEKMSYLAQHDSLTGLPNRILLQDRIQQIFLHAQRNNEQFAVIFVDLDHFKHVNDSLGHDQGDELLKAIAQRLRSRMRESDTVCRMGGDEFVVLLENIGSSSDVVDIANTILAAIAEPYTLGTTAFTVGASLGIALFPGDGEDPATFMKHADMAMYRAKRDGRNRFHFFSRLDDEAAASRLHFDIDMRHAIDHNEFELYYQPILDQNSGRVVAVETLLRWDRPGYGQQSPSAFIPIAEDSGLISAIGQFVIRQACQQVVAWANTELASVKIGVNVSVVQLAQAEFVTKVSAIMKETGARGANLVFEVTESSIISNPEAAFATLSALKALGIRIAVDDFGTGYSSLSYLKRFPVDKVKIDRSFVQDLAATPNDQELIRAILAMCQSLHMTVVAEGVETPEQARILHDLGCPMVQGNLYSAPVRLEEIEPWLKKRLAKFSSEARVRAAKAPEYD